MLLAKFLPLIVTKFVGKNDVTNACRRSNSDLINFIFYITMPLGSWDRIRNHGSEVKIHVNTSKHPKRGSRTYQNY